MPDVPVLENAPPIEITWERKIDGYSAFLGPLKVAVLGTRHDQGLVRNGAVVYEPTPRETWALHFTSPSMSIVVLQAILASLPAEA